MTAMVYKARRDGSEVVVDWVIAHSLDALSGHLADGWVTNEDDAREALLAAEGAAFVADHAPVVEEKPASEPTRKASKKR